MMRILISISAVLVTLLVVLEQRRVDAECCGGDCSNCQKNDLCNDCTKKTPYCGYGKCNIFGCNCDGGCRKGKGCANCDCPKPPPPPYLAMISSGKPKCQPRHQAPHSPADHVELRRKSAAHVRRIMTSADRDVDGRLTLEDVQIWATLNVPKEYCQPHYIKVQFSNLDTNNDGFITASEIDP